MTKEQLQDRIAKKEQDIEKINKRIAKWSKGLRPEDIAVCEPFGNCVYGAAPRSMDWREYHGTPEYQEARKNYQEYRKEHMFDIPKGEDWNKGPDIEETMRAYADLGEAKNTLEKYQNELKNLEKFDSEEKVEVLWNFLQNWRKESYEYYHKNAEAYTELRHRHEEALEKYKKSTEYEDELNSFTNRGLSKWRAESILVNKFDEEYYDAIDSFTKQITSWSGRVDEDKLNKALDKEVKRKYERLVQEVTEKAGEIVDANNLRINAKGEISGLIKGTKNTVELWATISGGNVQCTHIRSYVRIRN